MARGDVLKTQVDNIYEQMNQLNINKVQNDVFLKTRIMDEVREVKNIMGKDSVDNFKHYAVLMKQIEPMLNLKGDIIKVEYNKKTVLRDLEECMGKVGRANDQLKKDPTRNFTGKRR